MKRKIAKKIVSFLPQNKISKTVGKMAKSGLSKKLIKPYSRMYKINVSEIEKPVDQYKNINEFFTRKLKSGVRTIEKEEEAIVSPVDGTILNYGEIRNNKLIQAKGIDYTTEQLLGSKEKTKKFEDGHFLTIYLSPSDYHRIHAPVKGKITEYTYVPGNLYPVNSIGINEVKGLFTKNERLISFIETKIGEVALIKVGAFIVGSTKVNYDKKLGTNIPYGTFESQKLKQPIEIEKGDEVGFFEFGSTVILLFEKEKIVFNEEIKTKKKVKMGESIAVTFSQN